MYDAISCPSVNCLNSWMNFNSVPVPLLLEFVSCLTYCGGDEESMGKEISL